MRSFWYAGLCPASFASLDPTGSAAFAANPARAGGILRVADARTPMVNLVASFSVEKPFGEHGWSCTSRRLTDRGNGLEKEHVWLARGADTGESLGDSGNGGLRQSASLLRACADAAHAGDAALGSCAKRDRIDGLSRACPGTAPTVVAAFAGRWNKPDVTERFVGAVSGNVRGGGATAGIFVVDGGGHGCELALVFRIGTSGAIHADNGVLRSGSYGGDHLKLALPREISEFNEGILVRAVAEGTGDQTRGSIAMQARDALSSEGRHATSVGRNGEEYQVALREGNSAQVGLGISQVYVLNSMLPRSGEGIGHEPGAAGGTEDDADEFHGCNGSCRCWDLSL